MLCASVESAVNLKDLYEAVASCLDSGGFILFHAVQDLTGFRLSREFLYIDDAAIILVGQGAMVIRVDTGEQAVIKYKWQAFCQIAAGQPCVPSMKTKIHVDSTTQIFPLFEQGVRQMTWKSIKNRQIKFEVRWITFFATCILLGVIGDCLNRYP